VHKDYAQWITRPSIAEPAIATSPPFGVRRVVLSGDGQVPRPRRGCAYVDADLGAIATQAKTDVREAFERGRDFAAWLGLVPRQYSTGGRSILGRISKRGSKYLRTLFIQAANVILMRPHNWERFSFGAWLLNAAPRLHRNKLATALANKLARIAWSILRNEKTFDTPRHEVVAI